MRVKYNRVSSIGQSGNRFTADNEKYDMVFFDKVSGNVPFKNRPKAGELTALIECGKVKELVIEEFSRIGRNTGDVIEVLSWLEEKKINVVVRNNGLQSRPNGIKNGIWAMISSVLASVYTMELENIKERTAVGRMVFVQNGGKLGRPSGTKENYKSFLEKPKSVQIIKLLRKNFTVRQIGSVVNVSTKTVMKVKSLIAA